MEKSDLARQERAAPRRARTLWGFGLLMVAGFLILAIWKVRQPPESVIPIPALDPRLTFATPYRNVRPEVKYVGDQVCAECHADKAESYRQHPMGRSLAPVSQATARQPDRAPSGFEMFASHFLVEHRGQQTFHKEVRRNPQGEVLAEIEAESQFVLGSGTHGRSYLINRDGYLFQSPISWFAQKQTWDVSPGFTANQHFGRSIEVLCLFCHCNQATPVEHTVNRYRSPIFRGYAIGCERCHGPGELHVERRQQPAAVDGVDDTIVNPGRLEPALREAVCEQCHLQGEEHVLRRGRQPFDFRPGLPLQLFWSVFVKRDEVADDHQAVGHVGQMRRSRCFRESNGKLGCISCHDPHLLPAPEVKVTYYRSRCLKCHQETSCGLSLVSRKQQSREDNCIACHMPQVESSNIAHTAITNHRILRQANAAPPADAPGGEKESLSEGPLVLFHQNQQGPVDWDSGRDLGIALANLAWRSEPNGKRRLSQMAVPLLEAAVQIGPEDVPAWEAKASVMHHLDRLEKAEAAVETVLAKAPERERSLILAALLAEATDRAVPARLYWECVLAVDPWSGLAHSRLAKLLCDHQEWQKAVQECQAAIRINPFAQDARKWLVLCYIRLGDEDKGRAEFDKAVALDPTSQKRLRRWLTEQLR